MPEARRDLIAALATPLGSGAVAIVRLSGTGALEALRRMTAGLPDVLPARKLHRALVVEPDGEALDEGLAVFFPAPHSFTGEDVAELHVHGGPAVAKAVEDLALKSGARHARPGEFTERAVGEGKMDLLDAEALAALLAADDPSGLALARSSATTAKRIRAVEERLRRAAGAASGELDHPRETAGLELGWKATAAAARAELEGLLDHDSEEALRDGVRIALIGPANAGKSSLFNALVGEDRALVDAEPGTTRDAQPATLFWHGRRVTLFDTAGLRGAAQGIGALEARGCQRSLDVASQSEVVLWIEDGSTPPAVRPVGLEPHLLVWTKSDVGLSSEREAAGGGFPVSAKTGARVDELRDRLEGFLRARAPGLLTRRQHRGVLTAVGMLAQIEGIADDLASVQVALAADSLADLRGGRFDSVQAAREVYEQFCIGK